MKESIALRVILNEPLGEVKNLSVSCGLGRFLDSFIPNPVRQCHYKTRFSLRQQGTFFFLWCRCAATRSASTPHSMEIVVSI